MPNDFIGDLSKTRLLDLISPLLSRKKSGMIQIKGSEVGEIYIEGSNIVHARTQNLTGEEAVLAMMEWNAGRAPSTGRRRRMSRRSTCRQSNSS
jgi:hypothetical protein